MAKKTSKKAAPKLNRMKGPAMSTQRFTVATHDPQKGAKVYWTGCGWTLYPDEAATFFGKGTAARVAAKLFEDGPTPAGAVHPQPETA